MTSSFSLAGTVPVSITARKWATMVFMISGRWATVRNMLGMLPRSFMKRSKTAATSGSTLERSRREILGINEDGRAGGHARLRQLYLFAKGLYGCCFVVLDIEDGVQLGDLEQVVDFLGQLEQLELAALIADAGEGAHQFSDTGAVNISYVAQVEQYPVASFAHQILDRLAQHHAAF